jgi:hypothetical protein
MHTGLDRLTSANKSFTLVLSDGFEERTPVAARLIREMGLRPQRILLFKYSGSEHDSSYAALSSICGDLVSSDKIMELDVAQVSEIPALLNSCDDNNLIVCDVTGLSRVLIFSTLRALAQLNREFWLLYTEAEKYYPTKSDFDALLRADPGEAFLNLVQYERADVIYSGNCTVEDVPGFSGRHLPNYPLMIVAFLTFKRSRLGAILREYEANKTILIKAVPVRDDLRWRAEAMNIVNFDLLEDHRNSIESVETLAWQATYRFLDCLYKKDHTQYRFNILLAPLGSKMQTVGAWAFAHRTPDVRVITSTPSELFTDKYSEGARNTFLIDDLFPLVSRA